MLRSHHHLHAFVKLSLVGCLLREQMYSWMWILSISEVQGWEETVVACVVSYMLLRWGSGCFRRIGVLWGVSGIL